ncbi:MAG: tyrosine-type recombinase/integrase, partial [Novosphingobium sp.]
MPLIAPQIRAFAPAATPYKKTDERGLYLEVFPNGSKLWRLKYYVAGKEKRIALGAWPEVTLQMARHTRDELRLRIAKGEDPSLTRKRDKATAKISAANTFESVAQEYIDEKMVGEGRAEGTLLKARWFLDLLKPAIGGMPISDVDPQMMPAPLKKLEARGNRETAKKCRSFASRVFRYGAATGRCTIDPTAILKGALLTPQARHYAAILEPDKLGELLRAIDNFECYPITKLALKIAPHIFVRPGEMRHGDWEEIDLDKAIWTIPAGKM